MKKLIFISLMLLTFTACEKVIEVKLNNTLPQIVIEAAVSDSSSQNIVTISKSTDFYNPGEYENAAGAEVVVNELNGPSYIFTEISAGRYTNNNLKAKVGTEYSLVVTYDNKTYSAKSSLPQPIIIDSIAAIGEKRPFRDKLDYEFHCYFKDHPGIEDYARFRIFVNGVAKRGIFRYDDRLTDGNNIDFNRFFFESQEDIKPGDVITIELLTIDKAVFEYFDTMRGALASSSRGPFGSTAPSNPTTNWDNGAFGYFSAYSIDSKSVVIK